MKTIHVVAVVIEAVDEQGKEILFATQRGYGDMKGSWEFPGGKIEPGETPQEALKREIQEELDAKNFYAFTPGFDNPCTASCNSNK